MLKIKLLIFFFSNYVTNKYSYSLDIWVCALEVMEILWINRRNGNFYYYHYNDKHPRVLVYNTNKKHWGTSYTILIRKVGLLFLVIIWGWYIIYTVSGEILCPPFSFSCVLVIVYYKESLTTVSDLQLQSI